MIRIRQIIIGKIQGLAAFDIQFYPVIAAGCVFGKNFVDDQISAVLTKIRYRQIKIFIGFQSEIDLIGEGSFQIRTRNMHGQGVFIIFRTSGGFFGFAEIRQTEDIFREL